MEAIAYRVRRNGRTLEVSVAFATGISVAPMKTE
jgi:hypothetical protein